MNRFLFLTFLIIANMAYSQKYTTIRPYLRNVYEVFDYVHRRMYSDEMKESQDKLLKLFSNDLFTNKERKVLNAKGKQLMDDLMKIKTMDQGYDFQYCWVPIEKEQNDSTFEWFNKNQTKYSQLSVKIEDGTQRLTNIQIGHYIGETEKNLFRSMSCTQTTSGTIIRGKREGLNDVKPNTQVLALYGESDYWQEATFLDRTKDGFWVKFSSDTSTVKSAQIVLLEIVKGDLAYYHKNNQFVRGVITEILGKELNITLADGSKLTVNRNKLVFKINTYESIDTESLLFSK
jgi:hypothetical protein